jgi:uracil-DNA glycosylase
MNKPIDPAIEISWKENLQQEFQQAYFFALRDFLHAEKDTHTIYPPGPQIFAAFDHTPFDKVKVVILGQDPYHGPGQAHGLCFSVNDGIAHPPSLINIFKELKTDMGIAIPRSGNLQAWARQGVLLLNSILTVRAHQAGSHQNKGWESFTNAAIQALSEKSAPIVFLLWGRYAQQKEKLIDLSRHAVLKCGHPSPMSANQGLWFGNQHFSKANAFLKAHGREEVDWRLE